MEATIPQLKSIQLSIPTTRYILYAAALGVGVCVVLTLIRCFRYVDERAEKNPSFWRYFVRLMCGRELFDTSSTSSTDKANFRGDYLAPFVLGFLELVTFPVLFAASLDTYVGAWLGLKVVANYKHWSDDAIKFNSFLLGNALVLLLSFLCLQSYVSINK